MPVQIIYTSIAVIKLLHFDWLTSFEVVIIARIYEFQHGITQFCTESQSNCTALDQPESSTLFMYAIINNGNRTEWSPIQSVILPVIMSMIKDGIERFQTSQETQKTIGIAAMFAPETKQRIKILLLRVHQHGCHDVR